MPNIAKVFKEEITRLARKEVRAAQETVRAVTAQHKREITFLKSQLAALKRQVTALEKQAHGNGQVPQATAALPQTRFVPKGLISTRKPYIPHFEWRIRSQLRVQFGRIRAWPDVLRR